MKKIIKYLKYIIKHKWYVFVECCKLGIPIRGMLHDLSKLSPSEFFPYADYFYGNYPEFQKLSPALKYLYTGKTKEEVKIEFDIAWLKHIHRNPHHWQHWILREDCGETKALPMPEKYIKEMFADWCGAGKAITGKDNTKEWYEKNKDKMQLNEATRIKIELLLNNKRAM